MKRFLSSDIGAVCLIGVILMAMVAAAITGQDVTGATPNTSAQPTPTAVDSVAQSDVPANTPAPVVMYATQDLNLRAAPGADQERITVLSRGIRVELLGEAQIVDGGTWVRVRADGFEGWVNQKFLSE